MLAMIVTACLAGNPSSCKDYRIPLDDGIDPTSFMMHAPPHIARWAEQHPDLVITKFQCRPAHEHDS